MKKLITCFLLLSAAHTAQAQTNRLNVLDATGSSNTIWAMRRISAHSWMAAGNGGTLLRHHDSSKNWLPVTGFSSSDDYRCISFPDSITGYVSGVGNALIKTTNGGASWQPLASGLATTATTSIMAVHFLNANTGFIAGSASGARFIRKTINGGTTWTVVTPAGMSSTPYAMGFFDGTTGITSGVSGTIYRTTDGGNTWSAITSGTTSSLYTLAIADANTAIICGTNGVILRTADKGATWTPVTSGTTVQFWGSSFSDALHGMVAGYSGTVLRTIDGGITWAPVASPITSKNMYGISMKDAAHALVVGSGGTALNIDTAQTFHRLFVEDFKNYTDSNNYFGYTNNDVSTAGNRKWFFYNRNESNNGLLAAQWFPGTFAIYDASYYEDELNQPHGDSAFIETRALDLTNTTQLSLRWNEAFYTHPDGLSRTTIKGFNGAAWITLYQSSGMEFGDGVSSAVFPSNKRSIDISALAGLSNAKLRFYYDAGNTQDGLKQYWAVGDIEITTQTTSVTTTGLKLTPGLAGNCRYNGPQKLQIQVSNNGDLPVFPLEFGWKAGTQSGVNADYSTLQPGASGWYTIADSIIVPQSGNLNITGWLRKTANLLPANDTMTITVANNPVIPRYLGNDTVLCTNSSITFHTPAGLQNLQWSTGDTTRNLSINQPGTYFFTAQWQTCAVGDTIVISAGIAQPQLQLNGSILQATTGAVNYQWTLNGVIISGASSDTLHLRGNGTYAVMVNGPGGCSATSANFNYTTTSVSEPALDNGVQFYPNPAKDNITLTTSAGVTHAAILNAQGQTLQHIRINRTGKQIVDVRTLPAGLYFIHWTMSDGKRRAMPFRKEE